jgi:hypothetical protein
MIEDFVDQLDVLVCIPRRTWGPTLTREAALAAGRGCLLIVPPAYAQYFDDAAICAHETEIAGVIDSVWKDPDRFDAQQQRGYAWAESALTDHAFLGLLASASGLSLVDLKESS